VPEHTPDIVHQHRHALPRPRGIAASRTAKVAGLLVVALITMVLGITPAGAAPTPNVNMVAFYNGNQLTDAELPVGATWDYLVNYSCATEDCNGYSIEIPFPAGMNIGSPSYGSDVAAFNRSGDSATGTTLRFTMVSPLPPGTSGQMSIPASIPTFTTEDDTTFAATATMSSTVGGVPTSTSTVTLTARADVDLRTTGALTKGGTFDDISRYAVYACLDQVSPASVWGPLGAEANSQLTVGLPEGAVVLDAGGGTFAAGSPDTITWTLPQLTSMGCATREFIASYPSSDPANTVGAAKVVDITWTAAELGKSTDVYTGAIAHSLGAPGAPSAGPAFETALSTPRDYGTAPTKKAAIGDGVGIAAYATNRNDTSWTSADIELPVPSQLRPTSISAGNGGQAPLVLEVMTSCGPDRVGGTGDDGAWELAATVAAGANVGFDPANEWPSGADGIDAGCHVVSTRSVTSTLWPNAGTSISINTVVQSVDRDGEAVAEFDEFGFTATLDAVTLGGTDSASRSNAGQVDQPKSTLFVISGGPGVLAPGVVEGDMSLEFSNSGNPLPNPVMTAIMPAHMSLVSWSGSGSAGLPTPTLETVANWAGTDRTLLRWTFPVGSMVPVGTGYRIDYRVALDEFAYGNLRVAGRADSASTSVFCVYDFFGAGQDVDDLDGDGNTTEQTCRWDGDISPNPAASATVISQVKGSFDDEFVVAPAKGSSTPGSDDTYRISVKNNGRIELRDVAIVDRLPRPGDSNILTSTPRNSAAETFPVVLRGEPELPELPEPVTLWYSTVDDACQPELDHSPSGCNAPEWTDWSVTAPTTLSDVTNVRVDFGNNVLKPGFSYTVELPVTTPTTGATEPEFASLNPDPLNQPDEEATNTAAFRARRVDNSSLLNAAEPPGVTLVMPGEFGPIGEAPDPSPLETSGVGTAVHTTTVTPPNGGTVHLLDGADPVDRLTVPGVGVYEVDPDTGAMTFTPELGYAGEADPVGYVVTDVYGQTGESTWTATVEVPDPPVAPDLTSTGPPSTEQSAEVTVPEGGTLVLLDADDQPVESIVLPGVGTYAIDEDTGSITFTPVDGYLGDPEPVRYRVTDAHEQSDDGTYAPSVTTTPLVADARTSTGVGTAVQHTDLVVPDGATVTLLDDDGDPVTTLVVDGQGTYVLDPGTGRVTFTPVLGFLGAAVAADYRLTDQYGRTADSTYTPTVTPPPPPAAPVRTSMSTVGAPLAPQQVSVPIPDGGQVRLLDREGRPVTTVTIAGEGTYVLDPATGIITFTPVEGASGAITPVAVQVTDAYGQSSVGSYTPQIALRSEGTPPSGADPTPSVTDGGPEAQGASAAPSALAFTGGSVTGLLLRLGLMSMLVGLVLARRRRLGAVRV
jgi:CshA-type fibril repeat protein